MTAITAPTLRIPRRRALVALAVPAILAALPSLAHASPLGGPTAVASPNVAASTYVYTNLNTSGTNSVGAFVRNADGSLTLLGSSPISVGGAGAGGTTPSQGSIQVAMRGKLLLVADPGSNQISVLWINADGTLTPVTGSPFSSGGNRPISIAVHENLVYVANLGSILCACSTTSFTSGSNYTGFRLGKDGSLSPIAGSTYSLPDGSQPGDVLFDATGHHLVGTRVATSLIDSFRVGNDGRITPLNEVPYAAQGLGPFGSAFRPNGEPQLFVSNAHNGTLLGTVSAFNVAPNGRLTSIGASPYPDLQTAPCWVDISPDSKYLFATNTGSGSISSYKIAANGTLTLIGSTTLNGSSVAALDLRVDPSGKTLYVVENAAKAVAALTINPGGTLTELSGSPFSLSAPTSFPFGLAIS